MREKERRRKTNMKGKRDKEDKSEHEKHNRKKRLTQKGTQNREGRKSQ